MIILHQYPAAFGLSSLSPFCIKVETFLRMAKLPYEVKVEVNPKKGPKGKMPFIEDHDSIIADSSFIIEYLIKKYSLQHFDVIDSKARAHAQALQWMVEEHLYFSLLYSRWVDPEGYKIVLDSFRGMFPLKLGGLALTLIRSSLMKQARAQGLSRHSQEDVYRIGCKQIKALSEILGNQDYFFENRFTLYDATFYSFLATIHRQPIPSLLQLELRTSKNLLSYVERLSKNVEVNFIQRS